MIKVSKPKKYSFFVKVPREAIDDKSFIDIIKKQYCNLRVETLPKNILRIKRIVILVGEHENDFINNRKTFRFDFLLYTFRR